MLKRLITLSLVCTILFLPIRAIAENPGLPIGYNREDRLLKEVESQQIVLDDTTKSMIQSKCSNAQNILQSVQDESDKLIRQRIDTYSDIQKELQAIKLRMIRQGSDASETDLLTGKLQQGLDKFTIQADSYGMALDDVVNVDCQQKPEQFKAALVVMRIQRSMLLDLAQDLKSTMHDSDESIFAQLKKRLTI